MECHEFWENYHETGMNDELQKHLEECPECNSEFIVDCEIDKAVADLPDFKAPDSAWDRITSALDESPKVLQDDDRTIKKTRGFFLSKLSGHIPVKFAAATFAASLLVTIGLTFMLTKAMIPGGNLSGGEVMVVNLEDAEQAYLNAIEKYSNRIETSKDRFDPELYDLYVEKLAILDEYISQCREAVDENEYDINARRYLALAYSEKTETLKEMGSYL